MLEIIYIPILEGLFMAIVFYSIFLEFFSFLAISSIIGSVAAFYIGYQIDLNLNFSVGKYGFSVILPFFGSLISIFLSIFLFKIKKIHYKITKEA